MTAPIEPATRRWWILLRTASVVNLLGLLPLLAAPGGGAARQAQVVCATVYTAVCAFRSFFPRVDLERTVLVDAWPSAIALGRSAATVAELAFTVQLGLVAAHIGDDHGLTWAAPLGAAFVPLIAVAQTCCWLGVLTLDHRWHAAEEALWALMMAALGSVCLAAWPSADTAMRVLLGLGVLGSAAAAWVMAGVDIPMYLTRWRAERDAGRRRLGVAEGFADALYTRRPSGAWAVWRPEVTWMTPYFTLCVLLSQLFAWMTP